MKKVLDPKKVEAGSKKSLKPRLLGSIVEEMLYGNSPLAVGYRQYIASQENGEVEEQGWNPNTHIGVNLKTLLRKDRQAKAGKNYLGVLRRDVECDEFRYDEHFTFEEMEPLTSGKRNRRVFDGKHITLTMSDDGTPRLNFKKLEMGAVFSIERYALEVYNEICLSLGGLIEK